MDLLEGSGSRLRPVSLYVAVAVPAVALGLISVGLILTSDHVAWAPVAATAALLCGWGYVACGLVFAARRASRRITALMLAQGFAWMLYWLKASGWAPASSLGLAFGQGVAVALLVHLLLAYPDGHVRGRLAKVAVIAAYLDMVVGNVLLALAGTSAEQGCAECPANAFAVSHASAADRAFFQAQIPIGVLIVLASVVSLVRSYGRASPLRRRELRPVVWPGVAILVLVAADSLSVIAAPDQPGSLGASGYRIAVGFAALSFVVGLVWEEVHRRHVVAGAVARLSATPAPGQLVAVIRGALDDPTVSLGYWQEASSAYVDVEGQKFELPPPGSGRSATIISRAGAPVAAIVHDSALLSHPEAVTTIGNAAVLALENERLQADLRSTIHRLLHAEEAERSRIAEALHDDTIQAMSACRLLLDRAVDERDSGSVERAREVLVQATDRARHLMFELRSPMLEEVGLAAAITDLCTELGKHAGFRSVVDAPTARYPQPVEDICYRTVREAALNARRHAHASVLRVTVMEVDGALVGGVEDDGTGFDVDTVRAREDANLHLGIYAMAERVRLAEGDLTIDSAPGRGTRISFRIPAQTD